MSKIKKVKAKKILDSRGEPTVEVELETEDGVFKASVPSGASTGKYEAVALKAEKAIENINERIAPQLIGENPIKQKEIDELMIELDGTENKSNLGANGILPVSIAVCRAGAFANSSPLYKYITQIFNSSFPAERNSVSRDKFPIPCFNVINGGAHADNDLEIQEFLIIPQMNSFEENFRKGEEIYKNLKSIFEKEFGDRGIVIADEGGFSPPIFKDSDSLEFLKTASDNFKDVKLGLDCAASQFYKDDSYKIDEKKINQEELANFYLGLAEKYPIIFFEDPFAEEDWKGWKILISNIKIFREAGSRFAGQMPKLLIIGDDFTVTNTQRIKKVKENDVCNGVIIKPNQIGTVTETVEAIKLAKSYEWKIVVSHRSGETLDYFIADLAVGAGADFIKAGAPATPARLAKYNRLLEIEKELSK